MFCRNCGKELSDQAVMCVSCGAPPKKGQNFCSNCGGKTDPAAEICMNCGVPLTATVATAAAAGPSIYAGFWRRLVALWIDNIILSIPVGFISFVLGFIGGVGGFNQSAIMGVSVFAQMLVFPLYWLYSALMESSSKQATLGKMALGIMVTDMDLQRISFGRATGRYFGKIISLLILCIGFLIAGFTEKKQGLHDMMANCLVVKKNR